MKSILPLLSVSLLVCASVVQADTLTGRLVDDLGIGIVNGDVDAFDIGLDREIVLTGDSTDANGSFSVTIPAGLYLITLQGPPGSTILPHLVNNLLIVGTVDLGTVTLEQGYVLSGRVLDQNGFPVFNLDLDVIDNTTGMDIDLTGGRTDIFGLFSILVPANIELRFDPRTVAGPTLAPIAMNLLLSADTNLGDTVLEPGYFVSGRVLTTLGTPVTGADLDFTDSVTGIVALTLADNTDASGNFSIIVAAGTWDIDFCPQTANALVGLEILDVSVSADVDVGTFTLLDGLTLFGTVFNELGAPVQGVDLDVNDSTTGLKVALCGDGTDVNGTYSVFVPVGVYDLRFTTPTGLDIRTDVNIAGATQIDSVLSPCPPASAVVRNGSGTNPVALVNIRPPRIGKLFEVSLDCSGHAPSIAAIFLHTGSSNGPNTSLGQLLVSGQRIFTLGKAHGGSVISFISALPPNLSLCGRMGYLQGIIFGDPAVLLTNALDLTVGS